MDLEDYRALVGSFLDKPEPPAFQQAKFPLAKRRVRSDIVPFTTFSGAILTVRFHGCTVYIYVHDVTGSAEEDNQRSPGRYLSGGQGNFTKVRMGTSTWLILAFETKELDRFGDHPHFWPQPTQSTRSFARIAQLREFKKTTKGYRSKRSC